MLKSEHNIPYINVEFGSEFYIAFQINLGSQLITNPQNDFSLPPSRHCQGLLFSLGVCQRCEGREDLPTGQLLVL